VSLHEAFDAFHRQHHAQRRRRPKSKAPQRDGMSAAFAGASGERGNPGAAGSLARARAPVQWRVVPAVPTVPAARVIPVTGKEKPQPERGLAGASSWCLSPRERHPRDPRTGIQAEWRAGVDRTTPNATPTMRTTEATTRSATCTARRRAPLRGLERLDQRRIIRRRLGAGEANKFDSH
jgi:hypothetical protein